MQFIQNIWMRAKTVLGLWSFASKFFSIMDGAFGWVGGLVGAVTGLATPITTVVSVLTSKVTWLVVGAIALLITGWVVLHNAEKHGADKVVTQTAVQQLNNIKKGAVIEKHNRALPASAARKRLFHDYGIK